MNATDIMLEVVPLLLLVLLFWLCLPLARRLLGDRGRMPETIRVAIASHPVWFGILWFFVGVGVIALSSELRDETPGWVLRYGVPALFAALVVVEARRNSRTSSG